MIISLTLPNGLVKVDGVSDTFDRPRGTLKRRRSALARPRPPTCCTSEFACCPQRKMCSWLTPKRVATARPVPSGTQASSPDSVSVSGTLPQISAMRGTAFFTDTHRQPALGICPRRAHRRSFRQSASWASPSLSFLKPSMRSLPRTTPLPRNLRRNRR